MTHPPHMLFVAAALILAMTTSTLGLAQTVSPSAEPDRFEILDPSLVQPSLVLPPPPADGSPAQRAELAYLHALIGSASIGRIAQARADSLAEDPSIFDSVAGRRLAGLPVTWALLRTVQNDADLAVSLAKRRFRRTRPYGVDPTLQSCEPGPAKPPTKSYPSGHASLAYSVGYVLAQLLPDRSGAVLSRAADYALSREYCAVHFPSDTEASHVVGTIVAIRLLGDPRLAARIAAARAELATR